MLPNVTLVVRFDRRAVRLELSITKTSLNKEWTQEVET
jgi:hypothetical protein